MHSPWTALVRGVGQPFYSNKSPLWGTHFCTIKLKISLLHGVRNRRSVGKFKQVQLPRCVKIARGESNSLGRTQQIKNKSLTNWSEARSHASSIMHSLSENACAGNQSVILPETNHCLRTFKTRTNYNAKRYRVRPTWDTFLVPRRRTHYNPMRIRVGRNRFWHGAMRWLFVRHGGAGGWGVRRTARGDVAKVTKTYKNLNANGSQTENQKWYPKLEPKLVPSSIVI